MQQMCQKAAGPDCWMKLARRRYPGPAQRAADGNAAAILCHGPRNLRFDCRYAPYQRTLAKAKMRQAVG
jgi:hypothetical protein